MALILETSLTSRAETLDKSQEKIQPPAAAGTTILRFISEHQFRRLTLCTSERKCALVLMESLADIFMYFRVVFRHTILPVSATNHCCTCLMLVSGTSLIRFSIFPCPLFVIVLRPQCVSKDTSMSPSFMLPASCLTLEYGHLRPVFVLTVFRDAGDAVTHQHEHLLVLVRL